MGKIFLFFKNIFNMGVVFNNTNFQICAKKKAGT